MSKQILIIVTSHDHINREKPTGLWFEEFAEPYKIFCNQGYQITVASPKGGQAPIDPNSYPTDVEPHRTLLDVLAHTNVLDTVNADEFDSVFLPGGHGTMFDLPMTKVGDIVGAFADTGKVIGAVCHGPAGLVSAKRLDGTAVVDGYQVTGFTNVEESAAQLTEVMPFLLQDKLIELGANFIAAPMWTDHVIVDRNLVTGQNPQSSRSTAFAVIDILERVQN